ncbi:hypothetical protein SDRG_01810 [Saprolegnia diclina VS20]|uniref:RING-type domain-containing protein n=1 Tax=Saprolegnia diclina (strain VS20) TaxID=1156394 RepID=T0S6G0_SAPDV|nr:hypothetical protein SDRG_01810 [Saprolegnia diclina VS20]EQC40738.1 hypothetical protein SDRG_01810 [Saprolegnia diclina VS20]|eukprot:XP_008605582.1 hypothetical protein SDRG_01810 [Saprolegnia diclina VS20]
MAATSAQSRPPSTTPLPRSRDTRGGSCLLLLWGANEAIDLFRSSEALQGGFEFSGDQPSGFEFGDGQHDDFELGGWSPTEETKEPESQASSRPGGAPSPEISRCDFGSTRRDATVYPDSEVQSFVATPDETELSGAEQAEAVAEQQRRGAKKRQGRPPGKAKSLRGPAFSARKKMHRMPALPTDRCTRQQGPAPAPLPLPPGRRDEGLTPEQKIAQNARRDAATKNTMRLNEIKRREQKSIRAATPEERPALREYQRTWPSVGTYICDLFPNSKWVDPASDEHTCSICFDPYEPNDVVVRLPCAHVYHRHCLQGWLLNHDKCPLCIRPVITYK